jgi:predicted glycoside hydrolase/deacetylase ChbG (UPF0249 family)
MVANRSLIVNADDFGRSPGVNRGILLAHLLGIVTSASLMVRWPSATEAVERSRAHPDLSLGLHLDFGEWVYRAGAWTPLYEVVPLAVEQAVAAEADRQLAAFRHLVGRDPTHLDSHQHVHRAEPVRSVLAARAAALGVPLRGVSPEATYCGAFYGQSSEGGSRAEVISVAGLIGILEALPDGRTELVCHPSVGNDIDGMYRSERTQETKTLCDARVRQAIVAGRIALCSFAAMTRVPASRPAPA